VCRSAQLTARDDHHKTPRVTGRASGVSCTHPYPLAGTPHQRNPASSAALREEFLGGRVGRRVLKELTVLLFEEQQIGYSNGKYDFIC